MIRSAFFLLLALLLLGYFLGRRLRGLGPAQRRRLLRRWLWLGAALALVILAVTGRLHWLFGVVGAVIPVLLRLFAAWRQAQGLRGAGRRRTKGPGGGPGAGRRSTVQTRRLRMSLDHGSGRLEGVVLSGTHQGRRLSELEQSELVELLRQCRVDDPDGARLLEAYLDRRFGTAWRSQGAGGRHQGTTRRQGMSEAEAREILGVGPDATPAEIRRAHRRLMQKFHPDRGGSNELAARINQAKEVLLGRQG